MKMTKGKIRKEIKYSNEEWNKVTELSAKSGKLPAAYIRDQALNIKIKIIDYFSPDDGVPGMRNKFHREMNEVAKTVNISKVVYAKDVEDVEKIINEMGEFARNCLKAISMREVNI
jgi:predicted DNA-binding protein